MARRSGVAATLVEQASDPASGCRTRGGIRKLSVSAAVWPSAQVLDPAGPDLPCVDRSLLASFADVI